ncbi:NucA/NucB deoxyribonuclease domain-containing protein [Streptomyces sp. NPDC055078]
MNRLGGTLAALAGLLLALLPAQALADDGNSSPQKPSAVAADDRSSPRRAGTAADAAVTSNCQEVRAKLDQLVRKHPGKYATCVEPGPVKQARAQLANDVSTQAVLDLPQWCIDNAFNGWLFTRTRACAIRSVTVNVLDPRGGLVGQLHTVEYNYSYTVSDLTVWANQIQVSKTQASWGRVGFAIVSGRASCTGSCTLDRSQFPPQFMRTNRLQDGESYFNSTATTRGAVGHADTEWTYQYNAPLWITPSTPITVSPPRVRGDHALPGPTRAGVVFPDYVPTMQYSRTGPYPELAKHIAEAQASGLPGARAGEPLQRTTGTLLRQNRDRSCPRGPGSYPRPAGKTCDEYPFASTWQGASTAQPHGRGPARTYDRVQCSISEPVGTGPQGYSVCMIDATQNREGGRALNRFYVTERVLPSTTQRTDADSFHVDITP